MTKRVALARALALDPEIVFLDEPTSGLDPISAGDFDELIRTLQQTLGLTVFMVTHDLESLRTVCDRIAALADGKVIAIGDDDGNAPVAASLDASLLPRQARSHAGARTFHHGSLRRGNKSALCPDGGLHAGRARCRICLYLLAQQCRKPARPYGLPRAIRGFCVGVGEGIGRLIQRHPGGGGDASRPEIRQIQVGSTPSSPSIATLLSGSIPRHRSSSRD